MSDKYFGTYVKFSVHTGYEWRLVGALRRKIGPSSVCYQAAVSFSILRNIFMYVFAKHKMLTLQHVMLCGGGKLA